MSEDQARPEPHGAAPAGEARCGFIAIIGTPNAGKSTLVNTLVGTKVAIVSRKVQTTRTTLRGIAIEGPSQLVFIDTPGIFAPKRRLDRAMVEAAWGGAGDADMVLLVVDAAKGLDEEVQRILGKLAPVAGAQLASQGRRGGRSNVPSRLVGEGQGEGDLGEGQGEGGCRTSEVGSPSAVGHFPQGGGESRRVGGLAGDQPPGSAPDRPGRLLLALNKVDRVRKERLLELAAEINASVPFSETFMISALDGDGVADLKGYLARSVPPGPWHYPPDEVTDAPMRVLAAEITREKIYNRLHDELPYEIAVETTAWQEQGKAVRVEQTIFVERDSQKRIVLGKGGAMIKQLSTESRKELSEVVERPVHLFLFVKVRENWGDDPARYRDLGLTFPKE
jgi:GTP-binding protein Era